MATSVRSDSWPETISAISWFGGMTTFRPINWPVSWMMRPWASPKWVRGADLLLSTARQLLLYRALGWAPPQFFHCELMLDENGKRLAKRHDALSLRALREQGKTPETLRRDWPEA
jgi:hypothetical protein